MIGNNQTSNKTKDKLILSPIRRETELFLVGAKCEGVWRGRGQARNEEGNMIVITEDYVPFFFSPENKWKICTGTMRPALDLIRYYYYVVSLCNFKKSSFSSIISCFLCH